MKPEEIEILINTIGESLKTEEASNGPIYVLLSVIVTVSPFVFRYFKRTFVASIEKVMDVHVKQLEDMNDIMHLHIDELQGIKIKQEKMEEKHNELDKKVSSNKTWIDTLKDAC